MTAPVLAETSSPTPTAKPTTLRLDTHTTLDLVHNRLTRIRAALQERVEEADTDLRTAAVCWPDYQRQEQEAARDAEHARFVFDLWTDDLYDHQAWQRREEETAVLSGRVQIALEQENQPHQTLGELRRQHVISRRARHAHLRAEARDVGQGVGTCRT